MQLSTIPPYTSNNWQNLTSLHAMHHNINIPEKFLPINALPGHYRIFTSQTHHISSVAPSKFKYPISLRSTPPHLEQGDKKQKQRHPVQPR